MTTYAFLLDIGRCIGCQGCVAACKIGNELPEGRQYITITEQTRGVFPDLFGSFRNRRCFHCADAACVEVCPADAMYKEDGMTRLNRDECISCRRCVNACPYGVPVMAEDRRSSKCDGCAALVKAGGTPWCVKTCPSHALLYGERDEILAEARIRAEALKLRYPNAQVYGEYEFGGLGVIMVLPDTPKALNIPRDPNLPAPTA